MAVAASLVQYNEDEVFILPAWNKKLNVKFRLPVGDNFINAEYTRGGKIIYSFEKEEKERLLPDKVSFTFHCRSVMIKFDSMMYGKIK